MSLYVYLRFVIKKYEIFPKPHCSHFISVFRLNTIFFTFIQLCIGSDKMYYAILIDDSDSDFNPGGCRGGRQTSRGNRGVGLQFLCWSFLPDFIVKC